MITVYNGLTKGVSYLLYMFPTDDSTLYPNGQEACNGFVGTISKDDGTFVSLTNGFTFITTGIMSVQLTANEMNADKIVIIARHDSANATGGVVIVTGASGATTQSPALITAIAKANEKGYSVVIKEVEENGYNYYGLTNTDNVWWMIIRESTDLLTIGYKMAKQSRMPFLTGWTNRATLNYSTKFPLK